MAATYLRKHTPSTTAIISKKQAYIATEFTQYITKTLDDTFSSQGGCFALEKQMSSNESSTLGHGLGEYFTLNHHLVEWHHITP